MARNLSLEELLIYITNKHSINVDWFKAMRKYNFLGKFVIVLFLQFLRLDYNKNIFTRYNDNINQLKNFSSKINYNNSDNKFELNQYENEIEKQIINELIEEIILYLSNL